MTITTRARRTTRTADAADTREAVALLRELAYVLAVTRRVSREITQADAAPDRVPAADRHAVVAG